MTSDHSTSLTNHNASVYATNASFVYSAHYTSAVLSLLDPKPGEKIVDLGCGTGEVTEQIRDAVGENGEVVGIDSSASMLDKARSSSNGRVEYIQADIQKLPSTLDPKLAGTFDAVFTSAVLHWTKDDPAGVVDGIKWLLKPGGGIAFEFGGFGNGVGIRAAIHQALREKGIDPVPLDPWYFPTANQYSTLLKERGMLPSDNIALFPRPTPLPGDLVGWLQTFVRNTFFAQFDAEEQERLMYRVQEIARVDNYWNNSTPGSGVKGAQGVVGKGEEGWEIMYVRLRGTATKPA